MLEQLDLVGRTGELARAFGIDFHSVLARGSQYRVESLLARLAHSQNYLLLSPSREQASLLSGAVLVVIGERTGRPQGPSSFVLIKESNLEQLVDAGERSIMHVIGL